MNAVSTDIDLAPLDPDVADAWAAVDPAEVRRIIEVAVDEDLRLVPTRLRCRWRRPSSKNARPIERTQKNSTKKSSVSTQTAPPPKRRVHD